MPDFQSDTSACEVINPKDVIAWLTTQPNANGTLYLENVARSYISALRSAPSKLCLASLNFRNVFACRTVPELDNLSMTFKGATNYKQVNSGTSGSLSAGLAAYRRYLEHIANPVYSPPSMFQPETALNSAIIEKLTNVLSEHFAKGFRLNSPIELSRFRAFTAEYLGEEVLLTDEVLKLHIAGCGMNFDGKIYVVNTETEGKIKSEVDAAVADGAESIFYNVFYDRHRVWLFAGNVISEDMLRSILKRLYPTFSFRANYFSSKSVNGSELLKIYDEVLRIWGEDVLLSYEQLAERLPHIPADKISSALSQNSNFIWNATGVYTHTGRVVITNEERVAITGFVLDACQTNGHVSLNDVPLGDIRERNYKLSLTAVHSAVFIIVLAGKYERRGKIITRKGDAIDALSIMKDHCRSIERCTLKDLLDFEHELTGETHRWIPMEAGYASMVRLDEAVYVADKYVNFNIFEIDNVLDQVITSDYLPLKSIAAFATFPNCGQAWNLYILESYCRRFSERFRFYALAVNSKNAGVIIRKDCKLSYMEIIANAVAHSATPLDKTSIECYLFNQGYIGRRFYAKTNELIERARAIREGKG